MMDPITRTARLSTTSSELRTFMPVVRGFRCVMAKSDARNVIKNMMPSTSPMSRLISLRMKPRRTSGERQTSENTIEMTPATSRNVSRTPHTVVRVREGMNDGRREGKLCIGCKEKQATRAGQDDPC